MRSMLWTLIGVGIALIAAVGIVIRVVGAALGRRYKEGFDVGYKKGFMDGRGEAIEQYVGRVLMEGKERSDLAVREMRHFGRRGHTTIRRFGEADDSNPHSRQRLQSAFPPATPIRIPASRSPDHAS